MGDDSWNTVAWREEENAVREVATVETYKSAWPPPSPPPSGSTRVQERSTERSTSARAPPIPSPSGSTSFWERSRSAWPPPTPPPSERASVWERSSSVRLPPTPSPSRSTSSWERSRSALPPPTPPPSERTSVWERSSSVRSSSIPPPSERTSISERHSERSTSARWPPALSPSGNTSVRERQGSPWWWSPNGDLDPHGRASSVQSTEFFLSNEQLATSVAFSAEQARKKLFLLLEHLTKERGEVLPEMLNAWDGFSLDYMPPIPKKLGSPPDASFFSNNMMEKDIQIIHTVLQTFAVLLEEVLYDQEEFKSPNRKKWMEVADTLQQLLREVDTLLVALELPRRRVPRSAMPDHARRLEAQEVRDARDWLAARDLLNAVELLWYILTAFATRMENRRESQMRLSNTMLEHYGSAKQFGRHPYSNTSLESEWSTSGVVIPRRRRSLGMEPTLGSTEFLYGGPHSHLESAYFTSPTSSRFERKDTPYPHVSSPYPQDVSYSDHHRQISPHQHSPPYPQEVFYSDPPPQTSLHQHNPPHPQDVYYSDRHPHAPLYSSPPLHDSPPYGIYHHHHPPQNVPPPYVHLPEDAPHLHPPSTTPEQSPSQRGSPPYDIYQHHHPPQNVPPPHDHHPEGAPHFQPPSTTPEQPPSQHVCLPCDNYHHHHPPQNKPPPHVDHPKGAPHFHPPSTTPKQPLPLHDSPPHVIYHHHHPPQNVPPPHVHHPEGAPVFHPPPTTSEQRPFNVVNFNVAYAIPNQ